VCLVEAHEHDSAEGDVRIGMIAITPSTGDVIWDDFHGMYNREYLPDMSLMLTHPDTVMRVELEVCPT